MCIHHVRLRLTPLWQNPLLPGMGPRPKPQPSPSPSPSPRPIRRRRRGGQVKPKQKPKPKPRASKGQGPRPRQPYIPGLRVSDIPTATPTPRAVRNRHNHIARLHATLPPHMREPIPGSWENIGGWWCLEATTNPAQAKAKTQRHPPSGRGGARAEFTPTVRR